MAGVNGVEIKVGQVWRTREGQETIPLRQSGDKTYPFWDGRSMATWDAEGRRFAGKMDASDLIELVSDEHGFTPWAGGERPVPVDAKVFCRFENGHISSKPVLAEDLNWKQDPGPKNWRILAYKLADANETAQPATTLFDSASLAEETLLALGWVFEYPAWVEKPKARLPEWDGVGRIEMIPGGIPVMAVPGYELLADVLHRAFNQAAIGKGKERHANGEPFDEQVMQDGARRFGVGALLFQAFKKSEESQRLPLDRGVNELLGAIVYLAGAVIRREADDPTKGAF